MLPSLSTTDAATVPSLFKLVGLTNPAKSTSVFRIEEVRVLLVFGFTISINVSIVCVAVMDICDQVTSERSSG